MIKPKDENAPANHVYVGSTTQKLNKRFSTHKSQYKRWLNGDNKKNCSSFRLFEIYGINDCVIIQLDECDIEHRKKHEAYWIGFHEGVNVIRYNYDWEQGKGQYFKEYWQNPENKARLAQNMRKYYQNPENKARHDKYMREYRARKKAELLAKSNHTMAEYLDKLPNEEPQS
jgi:hypothetical protein